MFTALGLFFAFAYTVTTVIRVAAQWNLRRHGHGIDVGALEERLAKLEASVENIGAETQRLADGHRFFTQLLVNRPPAAVTSGKSGSAPGNNGGA